MGYSQLTTVDFTKYIYGEYRRKHKLFTLDTNPAKDTGNYLTDPKDYQYGPPPGRKILNPETNGQKVVGHGKTPHFIPTGPQYLEELFEKFEYDSLDPDNNAIKIKSIFRDNDRIHLIHSIITEAPRSKGGARVQIDKYMVNNNAGAIVDYFPVHNYKKLGAVATKWQNMLQPVNFLWSEREEIFNWKQACCSCCPDEFQCCGCVPIHKCCPITPWSWYKLVILWPEVIDDIREYFGEEVGLHALWLHHMIVWLSYAAVIGVLVWIQVAYNGNNPNSSDVPYFSAFIAIWTITMLEFWKRRLHYASMHWGTLESNGAKREDRTRLGYRGDLIDSPVDRLQIRYASE
jgi:hypothetical protein